jgi:hypothetical protein
VLVAWIYTIFIVRRYLPVGPYRPTAYCRWASTRHLHQATLPSFRQSRYRWTSRYPKARSQGPSLHTSRKWVRIEHFPDLSAARFGENTFSIAFCSCWAIHDLTFSTSARYQNLSHHDAACLRSRLSFVSGTCSSLFNTNSWTESSTGLIGTSNVPSL